MGAYLSGGAFAVGLSRDLIRDALDGGDLEALGERARGAVASLARSRDMVSSTLPEEVG